MIRRQQCHLILAEVRKSDLTRGGPAGSSEVLNTLVMKHAFLRFDAGYATAIGLLLSLISSVFIVVFVILRRRGWEI